MHIQATFSEAYLKNLAQIIGSLGLATRHSLKHSSGNRIDSN